MVLMYLHGFRSTPFSKKGQIMREAFAEKLTFEAPDLNVGPKEAQKILIEATQNLDPSQL